MSTLFNCQTCGACCVSFVESDVYCDVTWKDLDLLGKKLAKKYVEGLSSFETAVSGLFGGDFTYLAIKTSEKIQKAGPFKGVTICCCAFLQGSVLHKTRCRVYDKRPRVCRVGVKPGDSICEHSRRLLSEAVPRRK